MKMKSKKTPIKKLTKSFFGDLISYVIVFILVFAFFHFVILLGRVPSESMNPTIKVNDITISNYLAYKKRTPQRGDIIVFSKDGENFCKRVIGIPGDRISFHNGYVYINNKQLVENNYLSSDVETNSSESFEVPKDSYFVLGDNRENSDDSRFWDYPYVSKDDIVAKVMIIVPTHTIVDLIPTKK